MRGVLLAEDGGIVRKETYVNQWKGFDCSFRIDEGWWAEEPVNEKIQGRALHEMVVIAEEMWVIGGENFHHSTFQNIIKYNFIKRMWSVVYYTSFNEPLTRYSHSVVAYERGNTGGGQRPPTSLPLPLTSEEDLLLNGFYCDTPCCEGNMHIYKHPFLLQDSNPGPTAPQSALLTTILHG
ncbi:attractin-like protein 1 [Trichonephila clavipes]|nr:attractin-like protein 1 [Trichonephila clavipes]